MMNDFKVEGIHHHQRGPWPIETDCFLCGIKHIHRHFLPFYEDQIVNPEKTKDWGAQAVCADCHDKAEIHN